MISVEKKKITRESRIAVGTSYKHYYILWMGVKTVDQSSRDAQNASMGSIKERMERVNERMHLT